MLDIVIDSSLSYQEKLMNDCYSNIDLFANDFKSILQIGKVTSPGIMKFIVKAMKVDQKVVNNKLISNHNSKDLTTAGTPACEILRR